MDVLSAIMDQELGSTAFTVTRITYTRKPTGTTSTQVVTSALGSIHPGPPEMIQMLPGEDKDKEFILIHTDFMLSKGSDSGKTYTAPDRVGWNDKTWRVVQVRDWAMMGFCKALAVLMNE